MTRTSRWAALASGVGLAAVGAVVAYVLAGGPWAGVGAVVGAVAGPFAPSLYDGLRKRGAAQESWRATLEEVPLRSWARLLDPRRQVVGFIGREAEVADLVAWCQDDHAFRLRLVTGSGGVGKTRLAVELMHRMNTLGWKCERIADGKEDKAIGALRAVTSRRTLLVVDYAETRAGLRPMLTALAREQGDAVRVLLLARSSGDWWEQLGVGDPKVWNMVKAAKSAELALSSIVAGELSDGDIIALAVRAFARELGTSERTVEIYGGSTGHRRVLDLHVAALVAVLDGTGSETVRVDIGTVLDELLRHEMHFWYGSAQASGLSDGPNGMSALILRRLVATGCILGAASEQEARVLIGRVPGLSPSPKAAHWLRELYPPDPGDLDWLGSLKPDRLAELHAVNELSASPELAQTCLTSLDARQARRAVTLLAQASADYSQAKVLLSQILPDVVDQISHFDAPRETLTTIYNAITAIDHSDPGRTQAAAALAQRILTLLPANSPGEVRAYWLSALGRWLTESGHPADALTVTEEAIALYRDITDANRAWWKHPEEQEIWEQEGWEQAVESLDRNLSHLANSLTILGKVLSDLDRPVDALDAEEEAEDIYSELTRGVVTGWVGDEHLPDLARSQNNLGITFLELDRPTSALPVIKEAVALYRELAAASPDKYRPALAAALTNLGACLGMMGRPAGVLPVTEEAVALYRELAADNPGRYRPDLGRPLATMSTSLIELDRPADALPVIKEAVALYRELAVGKPGQYRPDLAALLYNLGDLLVELDRPAADALPVIKEAVALYRELAAASPDEYLPDLACSLANLGACLDTMGRLVDALPVTEEAVAIYRELAAASPNEYLPDLARSLANLGACFSELNRPMPALPVIKEAVTLYRELAAASPDEYLPDLAAALADLAPVLIKLDHPTGALPVIKEAVALYGELAAGNPDQYGYDLADLLSNLDACFSALDRPADALPVTVDAVGVCRELARDSPDLYRVSLASWLNNLGTCLSALDRPADALPVTEEAVALYRELAAANPDQHRPDLARCLINLADISAALDQHANADAARDEAAQLRLPSDP